MQPSKRPRSWVTALIVIVALALNVFVQVYALRLVFLSLDGLDNAGVPTVDSMQFPEGTEVLKARTECASGGCWALYTVRPPAGSAAERFADRYGADRARILGSFWDPRTISISAEEYDNGVWVVRGDYWTGRSLTL